MGSSEVVTTRRFEVIAVGRHQDAIPIRLQFWSVIEALAAERAYHRLGYYVTINPMMSLVYLDAS